MSSTGSTYGDIHRYEPARESTAAAIAIVLLTVIEVVFVALFTFGLIQGWGRGPLGNMYLGFILGVIFVDLAFILLLYRKEFLPDVMIVKKRRRKWEDLYISGDQVDGVNSLEWAWEQVKRAVYPWYNK
jgi:hypothetical protein